MPEIRDLLVPFAFKVIYNYEILGKMCEYDQFKINNMFEIIVKSAKIVSELDGRKNIIDLCFKIFCIAMC